MKTKCAIAALALVVAGAAAAAEPTGHAHMGGMRHDASGMQPDARGAKHDTVGAKPDGGGTKRDATSAALPLTDGEVRKIDVHAQKITLRHGRLENLGMAPMTMVFRVKDPAWLQSLKAGDRVRFAADRVDGALTVVILESAK